MISLGETHDSKDVFIQRSESPPATSKALCRGGNSTSSSENTMIDTRFLNKENHYHNHPHDETIPSSSKSSPPNENRTNPLRTINDDVINQNIVEEQLPRMDFYPRAGRRSLDENVSLETRIVVDEYYNHPDSNHYRSYRSGQSLFENPDSDGFEDFSFAGDRDEVGRMMPGVLAEGTAYTVKETIVQGYLEKKGSGFDWIGSRAWKRRWAVLVKARTDGQDVDVPLLQIFWDYHSSSPSTVISLDSAVVLPENMLLDDSTEPEPTTHPYRFKIQHVKKSVNKPDAAEEVQLTRILGCADSTERDDWVYAINEALLHYEKEKAASARERKRSGSRSPPRRSLLDEIRPVATRLSAPRGMSSPPRIPHYSRTHNGIAR